MWPYSVTEAPQGCCGGFWALVPAFGRLAGRMVQGLLCPSRAGFLSGEERSLVILHHGDNKHIELIELKWCLGAPKIGDAVATPLGLFPVGFSIKLYDKILLESCCFWVYD